MLELKINTSGINPFGHLKDESRKLKAHFVHDDIGRDHVGSGELDARVTLGFSPHIHDMSFLHLGTLMVNSI